MQRKWISNKIYPKGSDFRSVHWMSAGTIKSSKQSGREDDIWADKMVKTWMWIKITSHRRDSAFRLGRQDWKLICYMQQHHFASFLPHFRVGVNGSANRNELNCKPAFFVSIQSPNRDPKWHVRLTRKLNRNPNSDGPEATEISWMDCLISDICKVGFLCMFIRICCFTVYNCIWSDLLISFEI